MREMNPTTYGIGPSFANSVKPEQKMPMFSQGQLSTSTLPTLSTPSQSFDPASLSNPSIQKMFASLPPAVMSSGGALGFYNEPTDERRDYAIKRVPGVGVNRAPGTLLSGFMNQQKSLGNQLNSAGGFQGGGSGLNQGIGGLFSQKMGNQSNQPLQQYGEYLNTTYAMPQIEDERNKIAEFLKMVNEAEQAHFSNLS